MRRIAAVLAVLLSAPAAAQGTISGLEHHEPTATLDSLRGPVRSVRYRHLDRGTAAYNQVTLVTTYDQTGRRAEVLTYRADDLRARMVYTYDERGRNTGWEAYKVPHGGGPHSAYYDSPRGTPLPAVPERHVYVLDEAGRRMEIREIDENGRLRSRAAYAYDSAGRVSVMEGFDHTGRSSWRREIEYDSAGRPRLSPEVGVTRYDSLGRRSAVDVPGENGVRWRTEYRYDGEGRLSEEETLDLQPHGSSMAGDPEPRKITYTYHPDGSRTVQTIRYGPDGAATRRVVERFDTGGRRVEREEFRPDGARAPRRIFDPERGANVDVAGVARWTEELDAHGNWIRRAHVLVPDDGGPTYTLWEIVREITYW